VVEQNGYETFVQNLSGGEKTSCALAYRLALNKVINDLITTIKTKNLLILDEPTDGFSTEQLDKVRDVIEQLNVEQLIVVSHESKIESFVQNVIRVAKESGTSRILS
jgi:exonuclease SbcC